MSMKNLRKNSSAALVAATLSLACAAQAQNVIVQVPENAAELRANMAASMKAAEQGKRVGMITGTSSPGVSRSAGGMVSQELDASTMVFSVARIQADGVVEQVCVSGAEDAQRAAQAPAFAKRMSPTAAASKEEYDVK
jgi:ABC-type amino acid transport substrate-binding protein